MRVPFLFVLLLCIAPMTWAQSGLKLGLFGLPQYSYLYNADDVDLPSDQYQLENLPVMAGGIAVGVGLGDYFGIRFTPMISQQGGAYSVLTGIESRTRFTDRLDYVRLPLTLGFNTDPDRKFIYTFHVGASADLMVGARSFSNNPLLAIIPNDNVRIPDTRERYVGANVSLVLDTGFDIKLPPENFFLNLHVHASYGLNDTEDKRARTRIVEDGQVIDIPYWSSLRDPNRNAETQSILVGMMIGVSYHFQ